MVNILINQGTYGAVYRQGQYAVKICSIDDFSHVLVELCTLKLLNEHSHIVKLVSHQLNKTEFNLTMELLDTDLSQWSTTVLRSHIIDEIPHILNQVGSALQHLHNLHLLHLDIKPANILCKLGQSNIYKLADFGTTKCIVAQCATTYIPTTHEFASPEMLLQLPYDYKTDVWSLGVSIMDILGYMFNSVDLDVKHLWLYARITQPYNDFVDQIKNQSITGSLCIQEYGKWTSTLNKMTSFNPGDRPSLSEIINQTVSTEEPSIYPININLEKLNKIWSMINQIWMKLTMHPSKRVLAIYLICRYVNLSDKERFSHLLCAVDQYLDVGPTVSIDAYIKLSDDDQFVKHMYEALNELNFQIYHPTIYPVIQRVKDKPESYFNEYIFTHSQIEHWFI